MADINYSRSFQHVDWIDNEDVVQAGGEKGFNQKFHDLEAELDRISAVVGAIKVALSNIQELADGVVTTPKLADNAVTAKKIAANAVAAANIQPGAVTPDKIAFEQVNTGSVTVPPRGQIVSQIVELNVPNTKPVVYFPALTIGGSTDADNIKHVEVTMVYQQKPTTKGVDVLLHVINRGNVPADVIWVVNTSSVVIRP